MVPSSVRGQCSSLEMAARRVDRARPVRRRLARCRPENENKTLSLANLLAARCSLLASGGARYG